VTSAATLPTAKDVGESRWRYRVNLDSGGETVVSPSGGDAVTIADSALVSVSEEDGAGDLKRHGSASDGNGCCDGGLARRRWKRARVPCSYSGLWSVAEM